MSRAITKTRRRLSMKPLLDLCSSVPPRGPKNKLKTVQAKTRIHCHRVSLPTYRTTPHSNLAAGAKDYADWDDGSLD